ncbi:rCG54240 [Rattus norvegicus]|uniref:RCG54240 n=1 Tax=Rattus norvegicus TaxID=10116 RepID=A6J9S6_RAT|nr:rCG54240 [Rattus norvegicus]
MEIKSLPENSLEPVPTSCYLPHPGLEN